MTTAQTELSRFVVPRDSGSPRPLVELLDSGSGLRESRLMLSRAFRV